MFERRESEELKNFILTKAKERKYSVRDIEVYGEALLDLTGLVNRFLVNPS